MVARTIYLNVIKIDVQLVEIYNTIWSAKYIQNMIHKYKNCYFINVDYIQCDINNMIHNEKNYLHRLSLKCKTFTKFISIWKCPFVHN
jgi:hypothetical protein